MKKSELAGALCTAHAADKKIDIMGEAIATTIGDLMTALANVDPGLCANVLKQLNEQLTPEALEAAGKVTDDFYIKAVKHIEDTTLAGGGLVYTPEDEDTETEGD